MKIIRWRLTLPGGRDLSQFEAHAFCKSVIAHPNNNRTDLSVLGKLSSDNNRYPYSCFYQTFLNRAYDWRHGTGVRTGFSRDTCGGDHQVGLRENGRIKPQRSAFTILMEIELKLHGREECKTAPA